MLLLLLKLGIENKILFCLPNMKIVFGGYL